MRIFELGRLGSRTSRLLYCATPIVVACSACGSSVESVAGIGMDAGSGGFDGPGGSDASISDGSFGTDSKVDDVASIDVSEASDANDDGDAMQSADGGCPGSATAPGSACAVVGTQCSYGSICCGGGYRCSASGTWEVVAALCPCPGPDAGMACGASLCQQGWTCCGPPECAICIPPTGGVCAPTCDGGPSAGDSGSSVDGGSCQTNADCGAGGLCVAYVTNRGPTSTTTFSCRANPCGQSPLSCSCAASLCAGFGAGYCSVSGDQLKCDDGGQ
jgi:hypothetical protein